MIPKIGISEARLKKSIQLLTVILSSEMFLYIKTKKFYWNITGENYIEFHNLFKSQSEDLEILIDEVAERIVKLGGKAIGTMSEFISNSRVLDYPNEYPDQKKMVSQLVANHQTLIYELRRDIDICNDENHDKGTAYILIKNLEQHETMTSILSKYLF